MSLEMAVRKTLIYANKYGCSLTREECEERLIGPVNYELRITNYEFKKKNDNKYFKNKLKLAKDLAKNHLSKFDDILMVGVTGSVGSKYPKKDDDIDLLIITKTNRLWITRFWLKVYMLINKVDHRRYSEIHEKNKFCFNMWLDDTVLKIPKNKRNLKNAIDAILLIPLKNNNNVYNDFLKKNSWIKEFVATGYSKKIKDVKFVEKTRTFSLINWIMYWGQYWYMKNKIKKEVVNYHQAFFHPKG